MDRDQVWQLFAERLGTLSAEEEFELRHPDYVLDMPQSGERIRGRERMREMQQAYPAPPMDTSLRRVVGEGDVWVVEGSGDWSGQRQHFALIVEFRDGKILRETRYYAAPFEAPGWRAQWVEPIEG